MYQNLNPITPADIKRCNSLYELDPDYFCEEPHSYIISEQRDLKRPPSHGIFRKSIPCMNTSTAVFCCIVNFLLPGVGTIIASFSTCSEETCFESDSPRVVLMYMNIITGMLQLMLAPLLIGYIWSILWGITFIQLSKQWYVSNVQDRRTCLDSCCCSWL
uniref:Protein stum homolog n=1 Tax=Panagrellus redivivus TaxID=6233 RepID=A0A7E4UVX5_PANRE